jgi:HEAT repeat protein
MQEILKLIIFSIISLTIFLSFLLFSAGVLRRVIQKRRYLELDRLRVALHPQMKKLLQEEWPPQQQDIGRLRAAAGSAKWLAVERVLLEIAEKEGLFERAQPLFRELGYISYYENKLDGKNSIEKASAIDKLGAMRSIESTDKLVRMLRADSAETVSVAVRSLSKIGTREALLAILESFPRLVQQSLIARKSAETCLLRFGNSAVPALIEFARNNGDIIKASLFEVLSQLRDKRAIPLAVDNLQSDNPEIRAKALKTIETTADDGDQVDWVKVAALVEDSVWFVRMLAARAVAKHRYNGTISLLAKALFDENWHVRSAAAAALAKKGSLALPVFLDVLRSDDVYAKNSVCEEIQKNGYIKMLINAFDNGEKQIFAGIKELTEAMGSVGFHTTFVEYLATKGNGKPKEEKAETLDKDVTAWQS